MWFPWNCCQRNSDMQQLKNNRTDRILKLLVKILSPTRWIWIDKENTFNFLFSAICDGHISNMSICILQIRYQHCLIFHGQSHCQLQLWGGCTFSCFCIFFKLTLKNLCLPLAWHWNVSSRNRTATVQPCHFRVLKKEQKRNMTEGKSPMNGLRPNRLLHLWLKHY